MKFALKIACATFAAAAMASSASAQQISGNGNPGSDPALAGGTQIDFSAATLGSHGSLDLGAVTVTGNGNLVVDSFYGGQYNTTGQYLHNNSGSTSELTFLFDAPVSAFGFNLGAHDLSWTISSYSGSTLLDSFTFGAIQGSNAGEYYGLTGSGITSATLTSSGGGDYILLDNFTFLNGSAVPEPGTWAMMLFGFGAVGFSMRRKRSRGELLQIA